MSNNYLWDSTGEPDPQIVKLEEALGQFRAKAKPLDLTQVQVGTEKPRVDLLTFESRLPRWLAGSLLTAGLAAAVAALFVGGHLAPTLPGWEVARLEGAPVVGAAPLSKAKQAKLRVGEVLVTDASSRASVEVAEIGELQVDPGSRVRLLETRTNRKRIAVELGTIHAAIWAPPGEFVVDTPSATAVDLGCAYTLKVAEDGSGMLRTTLGWVGFHANGRDSFIPAGAMCLTTQKEGPGTPFFEDSTETFQKALHELDFGAEDGVKRAEALRTVLSEARPRDAFTLWHLLARVSDQERPLVYKRLAGLVRAPAGTTKAGTLQLDPQMMDTWWNAFGLGDIGVWRFWEQQQAPPVKKASR